MSALWAGSLEMAGIFTHVGELLDEARAVLVDVREDVFHVGFMVTVAALRRHPGKRVSSGAHEDRKRHPARCSSRCRSHGLPQEQGERRRRRSAARSEPAGRGRRCSERRAGRGSSSVQRGRLVRGDEGPQGRPVRHLGREPSRRVGALGWRARARGRLRVVDRPHAGPAPPGHRGLRRLGHLARGRGGHDLARGQALGPRAERDEEGPSRGRGPRRHGRVDRRRGRYAPPLRGRGKPRDQERLQRHDGRPPGCVDSTPRRARHGPWARAARLSTG